MASSLHSSRIDPQTRAEFSESFAVHDLLKVAVMKGDKSPQANALRWLILHLQTQIAIAEPESELPSCADNPPLPQVWADLLWLLVWEHRTAPGLDPMLVNCAAGRVVDVDMRRRAACVRAVAAKRLHWPLKEKDAA